MQVEFVCGWLRIFIGPFATITIYKFAHSVVGFRNLTILVYIFLDKELLSELDDILDQLDTSSLVGL